MSSNHQDASDSPPPYHPPEAEDTSPGEDEIVSDDGDLENPEIWDQAETPYLRPIRIPPRGQIPPSPSLSISTTTSEFELEHGEELMRVKRAWVKEEEGSDHPFPITEVISSDESEKPPPKKQKKQTTSKNTKGAKAKKQGMRTYPDKVSP